MRRPLPELLTFRRSDPVELVAAVSQLWQAGSGWVNCTPDIAEGGPPPPSPTGLGRLFGARGPAAPYATVVASPRGPHQLGILHAAGPQAVKLLRDGGVELPQGWVVRQDHPRRGLVVAVAHTAPPEIVVSVLLSAGAALTMVSLSDRWTAELHHG